jgi:anti-sigma B factor antagonist
MEIRERSVGPVVVLELQGRLVLYEGETAFREKVDELLRRNQLQMIVDLKDITYIDSAGVGVLVGKYLSVRRKGGDMKLLHLSKRSHRVMTITRLLTVFESFESEEEAVRSFASIGS